MTSSTGRSTVSVVIPAKNEEGIIAAVIDAVKPYADEVVVVDGHSTDATASIARARGARVLADGNKGKGEALRLALEQAVMDIVVFIDADGSHDPTDIPALVAPIRTDRADLVIASRGKGGSDELHGTFEQFVKYVGSQLIMLAINYRWGVRLTDSQNGFRAIARTVGLALGLRSNLTTIEQEMLMRALKLGYRVDEIASHEFERQWGQSKISLLKASPAYLWSFLRNIL